MPTLTEGRHVGGFLVWEAFRDYCREVVTIDTGTLEPGTVLGKITVGTELGWGESVQANGVRWGRQGVTAAAIHAP